MSLKFTVGDLTIHRIIEQETTFLPAMDLLPGLTPDLLAANKSWMRDAGALDADDVLILCFQSYIVKTPHHTILVDSCIGNDKTPVPPFGDSVLPVVEAKRAEIVRNDYAIGDHVRILPTPGHTPGHVAFTFGRGKDDAVFSGDLMHSPLQTRYPELSVKFDVDQAQAAVTRRNFLERYCDTDTLCCAAHFPSPSTGKIRRLGKGFSCDSVSG